MCVKNSCIPEEGRRKCLTSAEKSTGNAHQTTQEPESDSANHHEALKPPRGLQTQMQNESVEYRPKNRCYWPPIECRLISSLRFCISAAAFRCSSAASALVRASSSAATAHTVGKEKNVSQRAGKAGLELFESVNLLGLSDFEYPLSLFTKASNSCSLSFRFASDRFWSSGLYLCLNLGLLGQFSCVEKAGLRDGLP